MHVLFLRLEGFQSCQTVSVAIGSMDLEPRIAVLVRASSNLALSEWLNTK
jgi:hypothetical protein